MRYVVTGSEGFIGSHLVETLEAQGHEVVGLDTKRGYLDLLAIDLGWHLRDADGVFHLAGQPGVRLSWNGFDHYLERNLLVSQRVFRAASEAGIRVVYASSSSVYGDAERYPTSEDVRPQPVSPYGVTKLACEHLAYAYKPQGLDAVGLRYFTVYGPRQRPDMAFARIFDALANGTTFQLFGDGRQRRSFTYVADAVDATIAAMHYGTSPVYNIGGGTETTMEKAIWMAEEIAGRPLILERVEAAAGDARRTCADVSLARHELGWGPTTLLPAGMAAQWAHVAEAVAA